MKLRWSEKTDHLGSYLEAEVGVGSFKVASDGDQHVVWGPWYDHDEPRAAEKWKYCWRTVASIDEAKATAQQWEDEIDAMSPTQGLVGDGQPPLLSVGAVRHPGGRCASRSIRNAKVG